MPCKDRQGPLGRCATAGCRGSGTAADCVVWPGAACGGAVVRRAGYRPQAAAWERGLVVIPGAARPVAGLRLPGLCRRDVVGARLARRREWDEQYPAQLPRRRALAPHSGLLQPTMRGCDQGRVSQARPRGRGGPGCLPRSPARLASVPDRRGMPLGCPPAPLALCGTNYATVLDLGVGLRGALSLPGRGPSDARRLPSLPPEIPTSSPAFSISSRDAVPHWPALAPMLARWSPRNLPEPPSVSRRRVRQMSHGAPTCARLCTSAAATAAAAAATAPATDKRVCIGRGADLGSHVGSREQAPTTPRPWIVRLSPIGSRCLAPAWRTRTTVGSRRRRCLAIGSRIPWAGLAACSPIRRGREAAPR